VRRPRVDPGDALLHPVALGALALLIVNDHILKAASPGLITGKLSDVAGLVFFPLLVLSGWELLQAALRGWHGPSARALFVAITTTTVGFVAVKTAVDAALVAGDTLGFAQWLVALPIHVLGGQAPTPIQTSVIVTDPTDLLAIPAVLAALWVGAVRLRRSREHGDQQSIVRAVG